MSNALVPVSGPSETQGNLSLAWRRIDIIPDFPMLDFHLRQGTQLGVEFNRSSGIYAIAVPLNKQGMEFSGIVADLVGNTHVTSYAQTGTGACTLLITDGDTLRQKKSITVEKREIALTLS